MEVKRVGPWSVAKVFGTMYAAMGLIFGALFAGIAILGGSLAQWNGDESAPSGALFGAGAIVLLPVLYGILGVVFGALSAWLYNVFAGIVGGIEVQLEPPPGPTVP